MKYLTQYLAKNRHIKYYFPSALEINLVSPKLALLMIKNSLFPFVLLCFQASCAAEGRFLSFGQQVAITLKLKVHLILVTGKNVASSC